MTAVQDLRILVTIVTLLTVVTSPAHAATVTGTVYDRRGGVTSTNVNFRPLQRPLVDSPSIFPGWTVSTNSGTNGTFSVVLTYGNYAVSFGSDPRDQFIIAVPDNNNTYAATDLITNSVPTLFYKPAYLLKTNDTSSGLTNFNPVLGGASSNTFVRVAPGGIMTAGTIGSGLTFNAATGELTALAGSGEANVNGDASVTNATRFSLVNGKSGVTNVVRTIEPKYGLKGTNEGGTNISLAIDPDIVAQQTDVLNLQGATNGLATRTANLEGATNGLRTDVVNLQGGTNGLRTDVLNLQGATNGLATRTANLEGATNGLRTDVVNLQGGTNGLRTDVLNLQGGTNGLSTDVANLQGATNGLRTDVLNLQGGTNGLHNGKQDKVTIQTNGVTLATAPTTINWTAGVTGSVSGATATLGVSASGGGSSTTFTNGSIVATFDGQGSVLATNLTAYIQSDNSFTIRSWNIVADVSTTCVVDVWKKSSWPPTVAETIAGTELPTLTAAASAQDTSLTTWTTTAVTGGQSGDWFALHLQQHTGSAKKIVVRVFGF